MASGEFITPLELGEELNEKQSDNQNQVIIGSSLNKEETEKQLIINSLKQTGNNKSKAATLLGIDRKTLYNKLKHYDIPQ